MSNDTDCKKLCNDLVKKLEEGEYDCFEAAYELSQNRQAVALLSKAGNKEKLFVTETLVSLDKNNIFDAIEYLMPTARIGYDRYPKFGKEKIDTYFVWIRFGAIDWTSSNKNKCTALFITFLKVLRDFDDYLFNQTSEQFEKRMADSKEIKK